MIRPQMTRQLRFGAALATLLALVALVASSPIAPYRTGIVRAAPDGQVPPGATPATSAVPVFRPATHLADLAERLTQITPVSADVTVQVPGPPQDIATEVRERLAAAGWTAAPSEAPAGTAPSVPTMLFCRTPTASPHASVGINVSVSGAPGFSAVRLVIPAVRPDGSPACAPAPLSSAGPAGQAGAGLIRDVRVSFLCEPRRYPFLSVRVDTTQVANVVIRFYRADGDLLATNSASNGQSPVFEFPQLPWAGPAVSGSAPIGPCELPPGAQIPWTVTARTPLLEDSREGVITR